MGDSLDCQDTQDLSALIKIGCMEKVLESSGYAYYFSLYTIRTSINQFERILFR